MKSVSRLLKGLALTVFAGITALTANAQSNMPICSGTGAGQIYFAVANGDIYRMDPNNPGATFATGVTLPTSASGSAKSLAVSSILPSGSANPTYYTTFIVGPTRFVHYWNGTMWVNTGHVLNTDHIAGGGGAIYGLDTAFGTVYKYTGSGGATSLVVATIPSSSAPKDIAADCAGNFYIITTTGTGAALKKYTSTGALAATYTLTGTFGAGGGGLAVNGNNVYYDGTDGSLYSGVISGTTVAFSKSLAVPFSTTQQTLDFASCGYAGFNGNIGTIDTFKSCNGATNITLTATGSGPYSWSVLSGPAVITGTGPTVTVNSPSTSIITHYDANCAGTNAIIDTNVLFIANANVDAGPDRTIFSCGQLVTDTLYGVVTNKSVGVSYQSNWTPSAALLAPTNVQDTGVFQITKTTTFTLEVTTLSGCSFKDSVKITIKDSTPKANFQYLIKLGCEEDTVQFFNTSTGGIDSVAWDFVDSAGNNQNYYYSNAISPRHIFKDQGIYPVLLTVKNKFCLDTIRKNINVLHPLKAKFGVSDSTACASKLITFIDSSTAPPPPTGQTKTTFQYRFGDGGTSALSNPTHQYTRSGIYVATLTLRNYLGCSDSFKRTIVIDSLPYARILTADTAICQGQKININADYLPVGNIGINLAFSDGTTFDNTPNITYSFVEPGNYTITLRARYRYCPDVVATFNLPVHAFPGIYLGSDTVLCPYGSPIVLSDRTNLGNTNARYLWNTGETTPAIAARNTGTYWARISLDGCSATDSIVVNKDCYMDIPNSFTPNGDNTNDYFLPRQLMGRSIGTFKMMLFNRWGQEVFETVRTDGRGWDGKFNNIDQPTGVYIYQIDVTFENGASEHYTGNVTLLR